MNQIQDLVDQINEANQAHTVNVATLIIALMEKGLVSSDDLEFSRAMATSMVDQEYARRREEKNREALEQLWKTF